MWDFICSDKDFSFAFERPCIANPDLPKRIAQGWPLNLLDHATIYGGCMPN